MHPCYTHRPQLIAILNKLDPLKKHCILELGVGDGSSEIFFKYSKKHNVSIHGIDSNKIWFKSMKDKYQNKNYKFSYIEKWENLRKLNLKNKYSLIFIDQAPWNARVESFMYLKDSFSRCIIHDYGWYLRRNKKFTNFVNKNFHVTHHTKMRPTTAVIRNPIPLL
jgi:hypothetical protein